MDFLTSPAFWVALGQIIIIDILLGGDNAVVIALACRKLPPAQRTKGIIWGTIGAIILRVILIAFAMTLLNVPFLKFVGALLLVWIGIKLIAPDEDGHGNIDSSDKLFAAIKTIIVWGSQLVIKLMARFPIIITAGGMLLGWIAGGMLVSDPAFADPAQWTWMPKLEQTAVIKYAAAVTGALLVLAIGKYLAARNPRPDEEA